MAGNKINWDDLPSLDGLEVEWGYEPENPLGKRKTTRISDKELHTLLETDRIQVRILSKNVSDTGSLKDLSDKGLAVLFAEKIAEGTPVKVGFFLGRHKVISKAVVRNAAGLAGKYRIGMEFVGLGADEAAYILGLMPSTMYKP